MRQSASLQLSAGADDVGGVDPSLDGEQIVHATVTRAAGDASGTEEIFEAGLANRPIFADEEGHSVAGAVKVGNCNLGVGPDEGKRGPTWT